LREAKEETIVAVAALIPFIQPVAAAITTYFGVTGTAATVTTAVTTSVTPALALVATKTAQMAGLYLGTKVLDWSCIDAANFLREHCKNSADTIACMSMKAKEITSCTGSWILSGGIVYDGIDLIFKIKN